MEQQGILALVSKKAGHFRRHVCRDLSQAFAAAGTPIEFHYVDDEAEAAAAIRAALAAGVQDFLAVGGDGTVSLAASHLYGKPHRLGIIPAGTANTVARILGVPLTTKNAIRLAVRSQKTRAVDGMEVGGRLYLLCVSAGLSALSIDSLSQREKAAMGMASYVLGAARAALKTAPWDFEITIDNQETVSRAIEVHITNTGVLGTPQYHINESSQMDDGRVEVLALARLSPTTVAGAILDVLLRRKKKAIRFIGEGSEITIKSAQKLAAQGDGDIIGQTPVKLKVRPRAINFIV